MEGDEEVEMALVQDQGVHSLLDMKRAPASRYARSSRTAGDAHEGGGQGGGGAAAAVVLRHDRALLPL